MFWLSAAGKFYGLEERTLTGCLQIKNDKFYAVLNLKVDGKRKPKWIPLGIPIRGNKRKAEAELNRLIEEYEKEEEIRANHSEADRKSTRLNSSH